MTEPERSTCANLGPNDYLIMAARVHIMRRQPDEDGRRVWRVACGTKLSTEAWESLGPPPDLEDLEQLGVATCSRCFRPVATPVPSTEETPNQ